MSILPLLYLSLFLHVVTLFVAGGSTDDYYTPVEDIAIACGTFGVNSQFTDTFGVNSQFTDYGRFWIGDRYSNTIVGKSLTEVRKSADTTGTTYVEAPYDAARLSYSEFTYKFRLTTGQKFIRLHFYSGSYSNFQRSEALFSVKAGEFTILDNFNASAVADAAGRDFIYREFCLNVDEKQSQVTVNITFTPSKSSYAFINGIEIVSMPTSLYYSGTGSNGFQYVGGGQLKYRIENSTALETFYRLYMGNFSTLDDGVITVITDTVYRDTDPESARNNMYRHWDAGYKYLNGSSRIFSVVSHNHTIQLKFVKIPSYSALKVVYQTSLSMNKTINRNYNLTWKFPVDSSFHYLVRLHFCEFAPDITQPGDRKFQIYLANQIVEERADIIQWSGGNGVPVYRDYVVRMPSSENEKNVSLFLTLAAFHGDELTSYNDAIINGLEIFKLLDSKGSYNPDSPQVQRPKNKSTPTPVIVAGTVSSIIVFLVAGYLVFRRRRKIKVSGSGHMIKKSMTSHKSSFPTCLCRHFSLAEIKAATDNFNVTSIIGVGGFGNVYKGRIDGGVNLVAIKRLKPESSQGAHEFKTEIELLSQLRHRHLVSLLGFSNDKGEMILVYDYMARGTLSEQLYNSDNPPIPWKQRLHICIGAAKGLQYLHSGTKGTIIHRDVKSTNILLDEKWVAKVSDFGLSKGSTNMSNTHISTVVKGSFGYLDPEYYRLQRLTEKSDVYSFGVVLCEVLCGRSAVIVTEEAMEASLAEWAKSNHQNRELDQIIDPSLRGKIASESFHTFAEVAISCMHDDGTERPSMKDVVKQLELALELQRRADGDVNCIKRGTEIETSCTEQSSATNDSIKCISATIFSEINNPNGR